MGIELSLLYCLHNFEIGNLLLISDTLRVCFLGEEGRVKFKTAAPKPTVVKLKIWFVVKITQLWINVLL